jgi:MYND finger
MKESRDEFDLMTLLRLPSLTNKPSFIQHATICNKVNTAQPATVLISLGTSSASPKLPSPNDQHIGSCSRIVDRMDINNTSVIKDPIAGSGLAAKKVVETGDVIIQLSSPYLLIVEKEALEKVCSFCLIEASSVATPLKRCSACKVPRYCSSECQKKDWASVHQKECPVLQSLPDIPPTPVRALIQILLRHRHGTSLDPRWAGLQSHVEHLKKDQKRWDEIVLQAQAAVGFSKSPHDRIEVAIQVLCRVCASFPPIWNHGLIIASR